MNIQDLTPEAMRQSFHKMRDERDRRLAVSGPLRAARDLAWADAVERRKRADAAIAAAENPEGAVSLFDLDKAIAGACKFLGGATGPRPDAA